MLKLTLVSGADQLIKAWIVPLVGSETFFPLEDSEGLREFAGVGEACPSYMYHNINNAYLLDQSNKRF